MATEIRPSLAQMLQAPQRAQTTGPQAQAAGTAPQPAQEQSGFASALAAQRAFFQQVTAPKITPATYTAADIARATPQIAATQAPVASAPADAGQPPRRPGSFLNIVV